MFTEDREILVQEIVEYATNVDKKYKVHELVSNNKELLDLNYRLMQLKEVDINGGAKILTLNKVQGDIDKLNTYEFKKMFMADKMYTVIKDLVQGDRNISNSTIEDFVILKVLCPNSFFVDKLTFPLK